MDSIFSIVGDGFVLLAADTSAVRSIMAYKHDEDKIRLLDSHKAVAAAGPQADCAQFVEYIQRNIALAEFKTGLKASTKSASSYIRTELSTALRRNPYQVNLLIGGWDKDTGVGLYYLDYMGSMQKMNFGAHGYAGYFIFSTMDRHWRPKMSLEEVLGLARMCIKELATRFIIHQPSFSVKVVDASGVRVVQL